MDGFLHGEHARPPPGECPFPARELNGRGRLKRAALGLSAALARSPQASDIMTCSPVDWHRVVQSHGREGRNVVGRRLGRAINSLCADFILKSEEHTSELESLMRNSDAVFFLKKKK